MMPRHQVQHVTEPHAGLWWCDVCQAPADLEDPGEPYPRCVRCEQRKTHWAVIEEQAPEVRTLEPAPAPDDAEPVLSEKRLPKDRRPSLSRMYHEGFDFCLGCETVTELAADGGCVLCGSSQVEHRGPAAEEGKPTP